MKAPVVNSPLGIIALFVALIEAFLAYPVTQLEGTERFVLVIFMSSFPYFVASCFFIILWYKPIHLYNPQDVPHELQDRYQAAVHELRAKTSESLGLQVRMEERDEENRQLRGRIPMSEAAVLTPAVEARFAQEAAALIELDARDLAAELLAQLPPAGATDESAVQQAKQEVQGRRRQSKRQRAQRAQEEMARFRDWLAGRGFSNLPALPEIVIEPASMLNAYSKLDDNTAHFGALISDDSDTIAHTYFHYVLHAMDFSTLGDYAGETGAIVEGTCDYYACSYNGDPRLGEQFAEKAALGTGWLRNLEQVVRLGETDPEAHAMSLIWSGACWELRQRYGEDKVDAAVRLTLTKLTQVPTLSQAAQVLGEELAGTMGRQARFQAREEVRKVFEKRGVEIPE